MNASAAIRSSVTGPGPSLDEDASVLSWARPRQGRLCSKWAHGTWPQLSAGWLTPVALATHSIALNYASMTYMVPLGVSAAAAVSVGHAVGAGDLERARRAGWLALGLGTSFMLLCGSRVPGGAKAFDRTVHA